jgi:hypothetical protein
VGSSRYERKSASLDYIAPNTWLASVRYQIYMDLAALDSYQFDTSGGSQHITQSLETVATFGSSAPDFNGAIGVSNNAVEGVDIVVPVFNYSETRLWHDISSSYKRRLATATGKVNSESFQGYDAGEVLFLGANGSKRDKFIDTPWEISYRFAVQFNRSDFSVGSINVTSKKGWEYMWVRYKAKDDSTSGQRIRVPAAVYIEKVYETYDFDRLGL